MTDTAPREPAAAKDHAETARRMSAIAAGLTAAGLGTHLHDIRAAMDITATLHGPAARKPRSS